MALTDKLSAIGAAIREKTGSTELMTLDAMPAQIRAIETGGGSVEVEPIVLIGNSSYACSGKIGTQYIKLFGNTITTSNLEAADNMFKSCTVEKIPFDLNFDGSANNNYNLTYLFYSSSIKEAPNVYTAHPYNLQGLFYQCSYLRSIPEDFGADWCWDTIETIKYTNLSSIFNGCYSLRSIPSDFLGHLGSGAHTSTSYLPYYQMFCSCMVLDEARGIGVDGGTLTSNGFTNFTSSCYRLKELTFAVNDDGTAKTANWKNQTIDLSKYIGYSNVVGNILNFNSGITADKEVTDDATYQALKDDPDWFTCDVAYSRYNHDSAVNTINSLPDCSASGGTNTIKFNGASGSATDGGAISNLTEDEIAVATAKGWTVTIV